MQFEERKVEEKKPAPAPVAAAELKPERKPMVVPAPVKVSWLEAGSARVG